MLYNEYLEITAALILHMQFLVMSAISEMVKLQKNPYPISLSEQSIKKGKKKT